MVTVQVDEKVKKILFAFAAELQQKSGSKVSLSEAIRQLLEARQVDTRDKEKILSLYGCLKGEDMEARILLRDLQKEENIRLDAITGKLNL
jgi:cell fate regulator YaaT (PSP1 superfamily)